jgi:hypothetical protein
MNDIKYSEIPDEVYILKYYPFIKEFLETGDATGAYMKAHGNISKEAAAASAKIVLNDPRVKPLVEQVAKDALENLKITKQWCLKKLKDEVDNPLSPSAAKVAAIKLLGVEIGMFQEKIKLDVTKPLVVNEVIYTEVRVKGKDGFNNSIPFRASALPSPGVCGD